MGHLITKIDNEADWHKERKKGIGGSDAASIMGLNPYKTNIDLYELKKGVKVKENISEKPAVKYGKEAEEHLRKLFILDYPEYKVTYNQFYIHKNKKYPFIQGTFDGELLRKKDKQRGILEFKTTEIKNGAEWRKWDNRIPNTYYCQILHYFAIDPDYTFAVLNVQIKHYDCNNNQIKTTKTYKIERDKVVSDIEILIEQEKKFWKCIEKNTVPPCILPIL